MPHLSLEYLSDLDLAVDMDGLFERLRDVIVESGLFEVGAVRAIIFRLPTALPSMLLSTCRFKSWALVVLPTTERGLARPCSLRRAHFSKSSLKPHISRFRWRSGKSIRT